MILIPNFYYSLLTMFNQVISNKIWYTKTQSAAANQNSWFTGKVGYFNGLKCRINPLKLSVSSQDWNSAEIKASKGQEGLRFILVHFFSRVTSSSSTQTVKVPLKHKNYKPRSWILNPTRLKLQIQCSTPLQNH